MAFTANTIPDLSPLYPLTKKFQLLTLEDGTIYGVSGEGEVAQYVINLSETCGRLNEPSAEMLDRLIGDYPYKPSIDPLFNTGEGKPVLSKPFKEAFIIGRQNQKPNASAEHMKDAMLIFDQVARQMLTPEPLYKLGAAITILNETRKEHPPCRVSSSIHPSQKRSKNSSKTKTSK